MNGVTIKTDLPGIRAELKTSVKKALPILSQQVLKDCNYFCKQDQGLLIASSLTASKPEEGLLIWDAPYANMQYWLPYASPNPNNNALYMWCHKAYDAFGEDWRKLLQKILEG
nr:MAG TPA: Minor capsid protein [Caudoviricetes sp.]